MLFAVGIFLSYANRSIAPLQLFVS